MSTKEKILETALRLFSQKGYLGATTKEIAKESGIAEVTLFRHFPSKENLFEEAIKSNSFLPALKGLIPEIEHKQYEEALTIIAKRFLEILSSRKDLIRIMHSEIHSYPGKIHEIFYSFIHEIFKTLASYFTMMQKKGLLSDFDVDFGARAFLGMFFSYFNTQELMLQERYKDSNTNATIKEYVRIFAKGTLK